MITHRILRFQESFAALVTALSDVLPPEQRSFDQQQLLEVAQRQLSMLEQTQCTLVAEPVAVRQRRITRHQRLLEKISKQLQNNKLAIRRLDFTEADYQPRKLVQTQ